MVHVNSLPAPNGALRQTIMVSADRRNQGLTLKLQAGSIGFDHQQGILPIRGIGNALPATLPLDDVTQGVECFFLPSLP
jgi:hypothetical protein